MSSADDWTPKETTDTAAAASQPMPDDLPVPLSDPAPAPLVAGAVPNIRKAAMRGAVWIGVGYGTMYVLRLVSSIILTRLVTRETYGLMDVAMVFIQGLHMFADIGIGTAMIQSKRGDDPAFWNTAWTLQIVRGLGLWIATALIAWPVAAFYGNAMLMLLLPAVGATAAIDGLCSTAVHSLGRSLSRGRLVAMEVLTNLIGTSVTVAWMWLVQPSVWGFVVGSLVTTSLFMIFSHVVLPGYRNHFRWDRSAVHELLTFGKWIFVGTIITFFAFQADRLIIPKLSSLEMMGVYGRALSLAGIGTGLMSMFATQLVFPAYSRLHQEGRDIRTRFRWVHGNAAAFGALLVTGMIAAGPAAVHVMYGQAFAAAAWMLQFVAVGAWFQMLEGTTGATLLTLGQPRAVTAGNATRLLGVIVFVPIGYLLGRTIPLGIDYGSPPLTAASTVGLLGSPLGDGPWHAACALLSEKPEYGGFIGMLLGFIAADAARYLVVVWMARRNGMFGLAIDIPLSLCIVAISLAGSVGGKLLAGFINAGIEHAKLRMVIVFFCQGTLVVALWGLLYVLWWRHYVARRPGDAS